VSDALYQSKKIRHRSEPDAPFAEAATRHDFGSQLWQVVLPGTVLWAEKQVLTNPNFAAGTHQALPVIWLWRKLTGKQDLDAASEEFTCRRISRANWLGLRATPGAIEPGGKNSRIVEHYEVVGSEEVGKIPEQPVLKLPGRPT